MQVLPTTVYTQTYYANYQLKGKQYPSDSGMDLVCPNDIIIPPHGQAKIMLGVKTAPWNSPNPLIKSTISNMKFCFLIAFIFLFYHLLYFKISAIFNCGLMAFAFYQLVKLIDENNYNIQKNKDTFGYFIFPRSSITNTPLILSNSVGIIDSSYRGELQARVYNTSSEPYKVSQGEKLFQLCLPSLQPFDFKLVESLNDTHRGEGGFGSTN